MSVSTVPPQKRFAAIDVFRGVTIAIMIVVNTSGDSRHRFTTLAHSTWNGCTLADVVFPCFLFIVGFSVWLSINGRLEKGISRLVILRQAVRRSIILFFLGLVVNSFPFFDLQTLRIFGVLQRIAICYFLAVICVLLFRWRGIAVIATVIIVGYWVVLRWMPIPGIGHPVVDVPFLDCYANLPAWCDRHLLSASHLYHQGTYDPEGLLSTFSALSTALLGILTAIWCRSQYTEGIRLTGLLVSGVALICLALLWAPAFPLNKRLWTGSFVLLNAGIGLLMLRLSWEIADRHGSANNVWTTPFIALGTNALPVYILSELLASLLRVIYLPNGMSVQKYLYQSLVTIFPDPHIAALTYAVLFTLLCYLPMQFLYRKRIFIKV